MKETYSTLHHYQRIISALYLSQCSVDDLPPETISQYDAAEFGEPDTGVVDASNNDANLGVEIQPDPVDHSIMEAVSQCEDVIGNSRDFDSCRYTLA